jgi:hypothetical protein
VSALLLTGCGGASSAGTEVAAPTPTARAVSFCGQLDDALPSKVDGRHSVTVTPASRLTAAWGDPAVVLRCGVPRPRGLTRTSEVIEVDRVSWFLDETDDAFVFTTIDRVANVEVRVPTSVPREDATAPLVDLARPVIESLPTEDEFAEGP